MSERPDGWHEHELELQHEQELLRADSAYIEWLDKLEQEHRNDERK